MKEFISETIMEKYEFRNIRPEETDQGIMIEKICFPPHEACSDKNMKERILKAPELFLVAEDRKTGKIAGFLNGIATDEDVFRDEFFTDITLNDPKGENIMLLGLDVLPEHRGQGLATEKEKMEERKSFLPVWKEKYKCTEKWDIKIWEFPHLYGVAKNGMICHMNCNITV